MIRQYSATHYVVLEEKQEWGQIFHGDVRNQSLKKKREEKKRQAFQLYVDPCFLKRESIFSNTEETTEGL